MCGSEHLSHIIPSHVYSIYSKYNMPTHPLPRPGSHMSGHLMYDNNTIED